MAGTNRVATDVVGVAKSVLAALGVAVVGLVGCSRATLSGKTPSATSVPKGWSDHVVAGVKVTAPADWRIGPDPVCGPVAPDTIGIRTSDERPIPTGGTVVLGVTSCPAEGTQTVAGQPTGTAPSGLTSAWVSIDCTIAPRVVLPSRAHMSTSGAEKVLGHISTPFFIIGAGQAIEVDAGTHAVAQQIVRTVVPTGKPC